MTPARAQNQNTIAPGRVRTGVEQMTLAWYDRMASYKTYGLPRNRGEFRAEYVRRFFESVVGLGNVGICLVRGNRRRTIVKR